MRLLGAALAAVSALTLTACDSPADKEADRLGGVAENQAEATADAMENRADVLEDRADAQGAPADAPIRNDVRTLEAQAEQTDDVADELGDRVEAAAR
jgi:phage-related tail protein